MSRRVVVTGMGAITPVGLDVESMWTSMVEGRTGVKPISSFDATGFDTRIAAEITDFDPSRWMSPKEARRMDRFIQLGVAAANQALADSGLEVTSENAESIGVVAGSGIGGIGSLSTQIQVLLERGPDRVSPFLVPMMIPDLLPGHISIQNGLCGPNFGIVSACATSGHCIGEAAELIKRGDAEVVVAGGSEAGIVPIGVAAFGAMRAISRRNDEPERASRPFDRARDGFVMSEGGGMMVLESLEHAMVRGARIYVELIGYGANADAHHVSAPSEGGEGAAKVMQIALRHAGIGPENVDYINAHGTSTPLNDRSETQSIKKVFGEHAYSVPVSSTKSVTGHMLGAAGAVEAIACARAIIEGVIPPTVNLDDPDPDCDLDYVPHEAREHAVRIALTNSFGFGGHNSALVFAAFRDRP
jgi:3-oxoacyl-[acyl-carrier-protein] synthase II